MDTEGQSAEQCYICLPVLQRAGNVLSREQQQEPKEQWTDKAVPVHVLPVVPGKGGTVQGEYIAGVTEERAGDMRMIDMEKVISTFEKIISVCKEDGCDFVDLTFEDAEQILALLKEQEHKDRMYHALEDDWKRLKELLKEQEAVKYPTDHDNELTRHVLFTARQHVEECLNKARVRYGGETAEYLMFAKMFAKGIRDACWAIDELISTHNEGTEQNDE